MDNLDLFQVLAHEDAEEQERLAGTRAVIACKERAVAKFGKFCNVGNDLEFVNRLAYISDDLDKIVRDVADEYSYSDIEKLRHEAGVALAGGHAADCECGFCQNKGKLPGASDDDGDGDDGGDGDEAEEKESKVATTDSPDDAGAAGEARDNTAEAMEGDGEESDGAPDAAGEGGEYRDKLKKQEDDLDGKGGPAVKDSSVRTADGFSFCKCNCEGCNEANHCSSQECIESKHSGNPGNPAANGSSDKTAAGSEPPDGDTYTQERVDVESGPDASPKIDKGNSGNNWAWNLDEVDVPSKAHPTEKQHVHDTAEYDSKLPGPSETGKSVDVETPIGSEEAGKADSWTGTDSQADPVTSSEHTAMSVSKRDFNAIAGILKENGANPAIAQQIAEYFATQNERFDHDRFMDASQPDQRTMPISSVYANWQVVDTE